MIQLKRYGLAMHAICGYCDIEPDDAGEYYSANEVDALLHACEQAYRDRLASIRSAVLAELEVVTNYDGIGTMIGRCQLETCGRFFLIERGKVGKPRTKHCSSEHQQMAHDAGATVRSRKARALKKVSRPRPPAETR